MGLSICINSVCEIYATSQSNCTLSTLCQQSHCESDISQIIRFKYLSLIIKKIIFRRIYGSLEH